MNEERIRQVIEIEKQAQEIHDRAVQEAQQLPILAEQEAQAIIEGARAAAEEEARQILAKAQAGEESARILAQAEEKNRQTATLAKSNFDRAVNFVLNRVMNRG